jgi:superfamily II DNA/RNA helicase
MPFQDLPLDSRWLTALAARGLTEPTPVQRAAWEPFSARRDLIVQSGTGTGKTLAYLLPLFQAVDPGRKDLQGLILVPTQELAVQIQRQMDWLSAGTDVRAQLLMGGVNLARQTDLLKAKPHVVVGTPGRVLELLEKKKITGHFLATVVLDEADRLLVGPSLATVRAILKTTLKSRQTALFSASIPRPTEAAAAEFLKDPAVVKLDAVVPVPGGIVHWSFESDLQGKADLLRKIHHSLAPARTLVFVNKPDQVENLAARLAHHGLAAAPLHGTLAKQDRQRSLESFAKGTVTVLVASDLAARGLDIAGVTCVVHFDIPEDPVDFQHRCGRTGRAGAEGLTISLATEYEHQRLADFERALKLQILPKVIRHGTIHDAR